MGFGKMICATVTAWLLLGTMAKANCVALSQALLLTDATFSADEPAEPAAHDRLHAAICAINNDELLMLLKATGHASKFGDLRNILTQIRFVTRSPDRETFEFTDRMTADLAAARETIRLACEAGEATGQGADLAAATNTNADAVDQQIGLAELGSLAGLGEGSQAAASVGSDRLTDLLIVLGSALAASLLAYYGSVLVRIWIRNRRICEVPAELTCIFISVPGHITIIGRNGCRFVADPEFDLAPLSGVTSGVFCRLRVEDVDYGTKLITGIDERTSMHFVRSISRQQVNAIATRSLVPSRLDLSAIWRGLPEDPSRNHQTSRLADAN